MCGIFGHTGRTDLPRSRKALKCLQHRGPDQSNEWSDDAVYLGHQRLSIMDLSENGRQPMQYEDIVITVNGEIYNFQNLKRSLESRYTFKSGSDSEVLLYGYKAWGIDKLVQKLEGMYAFSLYDAGKQKLYLVRDRVGIKPLYYAHIDKQLVWASELKAIETFLPSEELHVDKTAAYDFLTYRYIPTPKTLYEKIYKLEPAHYLCYDIPADTFEKTRYWQLSTKTRSTSLNTASKKVRQLVSGAVQQQLMSDVPIGFFLSGGMDSSVVVAAAKEYSSQLNTYSIGFDIKEHDETHFADIVAKAFKTNHVRQVLGVGEVKRSFAKLRTWHDEPFADTSAFPVYKVSALARDSSTVVLTGDGGDEVFGGYNWYQQFVDGVASYVQSNGGSVFKRLRGKQRSKIDLELDFYTSLMGGLTPEQKAPYRLALNISKDYDDHWYYKQYYEAELPVLTRLQYLDFHTYLPDDILTKVDRVSMAVALECRVPLLSTELIEYLFSVPEDIRYHDGELKGLMKHAYRKILPKEIIDRSKKGFSIPTGKWKGDLLGKKITVPEYILEELYPEISIQKGS